MDFSNYFVPNKPNLTNMRQPVQTRSYGTTSTPDLCKKRDAIYANQSFKLMTPAGLSVPNSVHINNNLNTIVMDKCGKPIEVSVMNSHNRLGSIFSDRGFQKDHNACHVTIGCNVLLNNYTVISRSKSMPPDLQKFVYKSTPHEKGKLNLRLPVKCDTEVIKNMLSSADSRLNTDHTETMDVSKKNHPVSNNSSEDNKLRKLRQMFANTHRKLNKPNTKESGFFYSLDEIDKHCDNIFITTPESAISYDFLPFNFNIKQNMTADTSLIKYPCVSVNAESCQLAVAETGSSSRLNDNEKIVTDLNHIANDSSEADNESRSDQNKSGKSDKKSFHNMTTLTLDLSNNDVLYKKEHCVTTGGNVYTKADTEKETQEIIASVSLPDSNESLLARCQIDKIESNITEINAECEGVTDACLEKITRPESKYHIGFVDQTLSSDSDKRREDNQFNSDGKSHEESLQSFDVVDYAAVTKGESQSGQKSHEKSPAMPYALRQLEGRINHSKYPPRAHSEVVDKTIQVSEGIDAILKRLGRHDDKSLNDTMKSHDNSLHRLSAGDNNHPSQQKVSRFLLKRAQEKEAEAAKKAQKEAQEQRDSVLSCEDKMKRLKQLFSSKKSESFSENEVSGELDPLQVDSSTTGKLKCYSQISVDSSITDKQNSSDDNMPTCNSEGNSSKQTNLIKSDHNFYHTEAASDQDCCCEPRLNDPAVDSVDNDNICKSLTVSIETQIIVEKEIECQIIPSEPISLQAEVNIGESNIVENDGNLPQCSTSSIKNDVELDVKTESISREDITCNTSSETKESVVGNVENDIKIESSKAAPTSHLEISANSDSTETKQPVDLEPVKSVIIDKCEDKMATLKAMLAERKLKKSKKYITKETEAVDSEKLKKTIMPIVNKEPKKLMNKCSPDTNNKSVQESKSEVKPCDVKQNKPAAVKAVEIKQIKAPVKTVEVKQNKAPTVKAVEVKQNKVPAVKIVEAKQIKVPSVKLSEAKQNKTASSASGEIKQNKTAIVKNVDIKLDKDRNAKTVTDPITDQENKGTPLTVVLEDKEKEPLSKNDVEISSPSDVIHTDICAKTVRTKRSKGKSAKKANRKHKNEHSSKKDRHKERDDHKKDIRDDLTFDTEVEQTTGPLYFSTDTLKLHTESKKRHHGKKNKSNVLERLDKCVNFISSLPAKVAICKPSMLEVHDENLLPNKSSEEFVIVDKEELLAKKEKKLCRVRAPSECESEDSFVICFQGSQEDLRNPLDSDDDDDFSDSACSETDSSDDDDDSSSGSCSDDGYEGLAEKSEDVDSGVIVGIMKKRGSRDSPGKSVAIVDKKVSFTASPPKIHKMITWAYAYRQARIGTWERCARDAERFRQRITDTSLCLDWVLKREHRARVYFQRFRPLLMRAIREEKEAKAKKVKEEKERAIKEKEMEEELMKQREIEEKEKAEQLERDGMMIVDDALNDKNIDKIDDLNVTVCNNSDLVIVGSIKEKNIIDDEKPLIVNENEKCDNSKIFNIKKGSAAVRTGKNGTRNVKPVSPAK